MKRIRALLCCLILAASMALLPAPGPAAARTGGASCAGVAGRHSTPVTERQSRRSRPVVLVHGWTGSPLTDTARRLRALLPGRISTFTFDYSNWSDYWAADTHIAPCLADYLHDVSTAYRQAGGDGKIIVVAHSMGGLAVRYAMDAQTVAHPVSAATVPYVITLGTPFGGSPWPSWVAGPWQRVQAGHDHDRPSGADGARCLGEHHNEQGLAEGCGNAPPWLPPGVRLTQIAGDVTVDRTLFGIRLYSLPLHSDGVVPVGSALGYHDSGPTPADPGGTSIRQRTDACRVDFGLVRSAAALYFPGLSGALDLLTAEDLRAGRFTVPVGAYSAGAARRASCGHTGLTTDQSALNQVTETIKTALDDLAPTPATKIVTLAGVTADGAVAPGFTATQQHATVDWCSASLAAAAPDIVRCGDTADSADICWVGTDRHTLWCGQDPWDKRLLGYTAAEAVPPTAAQPDPQPWALELADGHRCRLRNGGSWGGRADGLVGAYGCGTSESEIVLATQSESDPVVDKSKPTWTVRVGPLGEPDQQFPPPRTVRVTTAYLAGSP